MELRTLGRTGIQVSQLCFGTMSFGGDADEATSAAMYRRCRAAGINFFDTANAYSKGRSEEILGKLIASERDEIVLTSKVWNKMADDPNARGLSRRHIMLACEASLKRLKTDRLDLYFCHHFDALTPMDVTLRALDDLVRAGKVLHPAVSNWSAWQIAKALGISAKDSLARFECIQPMYSLVKRQAEVEILPLAQSEHVGVIPYSPLGGGVLTGKYGAKGDAGGEQNRLVANKMYTKRYGDPVIFDVAQAFVAHAKERGVHPVSLGLAWVGSHPAVTAPIVGARNVEQLEPALKSVEVKLSPEEREAISALSPAPGIATDRTEERPGEGKS